MDTQTAIDEAVKAERTAVCNYLERVGYENVALVNTLRDSPEKSTLKKLGESYIATAYVLIELKKIIEDGFHIKDE